MNEFQVVNLPSANGRMSKGRMSKHAALVAAVKALPPGKAIQYELNGATLVNFRQALMAALKRMNEPKMHVTKGPNNTAYIWPHEDAEVLRP